ncbi:hypothetical protein BV22DRAFT_981269, partial [Leucogyrophana mollusca]
LVEYACCPKCFSTYKPDHSYPMPYPKECTFRETPADDLCGTQLLRREERGKPLSGQRPIK